ncbi:MAG TPA: GWxTD domain-containing protein [Gemmatimonadales bacterium]|nr:GWxTD domain-containing protein [Gemmatimonadales bacterium]
MPRFRLPRQARAAALGSLLVVLGCGGGPAPAGGVTPSTEQTLAELFNLASVYQRIGRIAAAGPMPFVGSVGYAAGRGDSTIARVGLSFDNHAFAFQREPGSFSTRFRIEYGFVPTGAGADPVRATRDEVVRVQSFQETQRSDESVIVEQGFLLAPGTYTLTITARDPAATVFSRAEQRIDVPAFGPGSTTPPMLVYMAGARAEVTDSLRVLLNPRGTVASGASDTLLMYVEGYRFPAPTQVPVEVRDERDSVVYRAEIGFAGGRNVEGKIVRFYSDAPPLGELHITVGGGVSPTHKTTALVSFSRNWVVTSYDNLLSLLRYFPWQSHMLGGLRDAQPTERSERWREFWVATDPIPETPENEALDRYFTRIAIANERFRDEGGPGWRTDRGEVYVTLGDPDQVYESSPASDRRIIQWLYNTYRVVLTFEGTLGFSRLRLTPSSRGEFNKAKSQAIRDGPPR